MALRVPVNSAPNIFIKSKNNLDLIKDHLYMIESLVKPQAKNAVIKTLESEEPNPEGCLKNLVNEDVTLYIQVVGLIDIKLEIQRLEKRNGELNKLIEALQKKMKNYSEKVPQDIRDEDKNKFDTYSSELQFVVESIKDLNTLI